MFNISKKVKFDNGQSRKGLEQKVKERAEDLDLSNYFLRESMKQLKKRSTELQEYSGILEARVMERTAKFEEVKRHQIEQAKETFKAKTEFSSVFSHQLLSPLTATKLVLEDFSTGMLGPLNVEQKETVKDVTLRLEELMRIVNDLLKSSRAEAGKLEAEPQVVDIEKLIEKIIKEVESLAKAKTCKIHFTVEGTKLPKALIDPSLFHHVIYNIITNAIRYSSSSQCNTFVSLGKKGTKEFIISIRDEGIGINDEDQSKVFEKFFRAEDAIKLEIKGTGLGLYAVKMIVEILGGKVWFKSPAPPVKSGPAKASRVRKTSKGTIFYITLPLKAKRIKKDQKNVGVKR